MSDVPFYLTRSGHDFYERTMPSLLRELARLNENLERLIGSTAPEPTADDEGAGPSTTEGDDR